MTHSRVFRTFLSSDAILTTASIVTGFLMTNALSDEGSSEPLLDTIIKIAVLAIWLVALAGLWRFRNWARVLYVAVASIGLLASLLLGSEARSGMQASLNALCWLVTGVIIALAYWSPVAAMFKSKRQLLPNKELAC
jgi:hypothetical protein